MMCTKMLYLKLKKKLTLIITDTAKQVKSNKDLISIKFAAVTNSNNNARSTSTNSAYHFCTISSILFDFNGVVMAVTVITVW